MASFDLILRTRASLHPDGEPKVLRVPPSWLPKHTSKEERRAATVKLRRYFRRMGFRRLGRTPYYALSMSQVTPGAAELLGGA
jgi:hypothetical protein